MFGAIYVGLSGLTAYSRGLQQVSNNVTNLNSLGFKATTVSFSDLVNIHGNGGLSYSGGSSDSGGGVDIDESNRNFHQGELRTTDRDLDLAIDGSGFLVLTKGDQIFYTRTGSFEVDANGFIVLAGTDYRLATLNADGKAVSLSIDSSRTSAPKPTTSIKFSDNLSADLSLPASDPNFSIGDVHVFDAAGGEHVWTVKFSRATDPLAEPGSWNVKVTDAAGKVIGTQILKFDAGGHVDPSTTQLVFADADSTLSVTLDFAKDVTSFASGNVSTLRAASVDGFKVGAITGLQVNADGMLEIAYSNNQKEQIGAVAIADFRDPQALEQRGGGLFVEGSPAGRELTMTGDARVGRVLSRRLEASNVDLAQQFGDLILIQRGFQASSQIISVSNDMIQQLFGIRGQG